MGSTAQDDLARLAQALGVTLDDERRERVAEEQLRMVLSHTRSGTLAATAFALVMALHLAPGPGAAWLYGWIAAKLAVGLTRVALWKARQRVVLPQHKPRWRLLTYSLLALDGAVFGVAGYWAMGQPEPTAALVAAVLACIGCVATFGLQVRLVATAAYVVPMLVPTALALMQRGDDFGWVGGGGLLLLLGLTLVTARGAQRRLAANELLKLHAQALVTQKDDALSLAERQSVAKSQFIAKVSHELRTPLHGILGLARLMRSRPLEPETAERVALIEGSGTHLLSLINDLLDVSRIESGRFQLHNRAFNLHDEVDQVLQVFAVRAADKGLSLRLESTLPRTRWVMADPARMRQVLHNLLGNAIKFTPRGSILLTLGPGESADMVRIAVSDSGVGIAEQDLQRIFQPFAQTGAGSGAPTDGAGLGLTIAREIAQGMGGDIAVHSQLGQGSTFVFTARMAALASPPPATAPTGLNTVPPPPIPPKPSPPPRPGSLPLPHRVLVAEDDEVNAMIVLAYLEALGVQAQRVSNGAQAVQAVQAARQTGRAPELVLMDCRMPEMDGLEATRRIRQDEATQGLARLPIVALTATGGELDRGACLAAGMDEFVAKPFTRDELAQAMARVSGAPA